MITELAQPTPSNPRSDERLIVEAEALCKSYTRGTATTKVLDGVDVQVTAGESVFLLGPSGSGKTTLMSLIGCLLTPDSGSLKVFGHRVDQFSTEQKSELRRRHIGFVFQKHFLLRGLTAIENVVTPLRLDPAYDPDSANKRGKLLLERVGLVDKANESPNRLSVGQCQRVAIARALVADPDLVLADEPTASLDANSGQQAMHLLRELTVESGKTLIVVTHDHRILPFAQRTLTMENGKLTNEI